MKYFIFCFFLLSSMISNAQTTVFSMRDMDYGMNEKFVTLENGIEIAYIDQGSGTETIVFIHGLASYIPAWKNNLSVLKDNYRCIAIDLPGYGKSSKGNYDVSMDFFADIVNSLSTKLNLKNIVIAGHSMGGQIAIATALKYPELVKKLILVAPAGFETFNKGERQWFRDVMTVDGVRLTTVSQIRLNYAYNFYDMPADAQFMVDDRIKIRGAKDFTDYCYHITQGVAAMVDTPVFSYLGDIKQPTLCIFGANDNLIPNRYLNGGRTEKFAKAGADKIPNSTLHMVDKGGHFIMFEKATEVNALIEEYLK